MPWSRRPHACAGTCPSRSSTPSSSPASSVEPVDAELSAPELARLLVDRAVDDRRRLARLVRRRPRAHRRDRLRGVPARDAARGRDGRRLVGRARLAAARRRRRHGPAALAGRVPVGREADARVACASTSPRRPARPSRPSSRGTGSTSPRSSATCCSRCSSTRGWPRTPRPTSERFDIDDVAGGLVAKLVRRHPHVFADGDASTPEEVEEAWARIKAEEKAAKQRPLTTSGPWHAGATHDRRSPDVVPTAPASRTAAGRSAMTGGPSRCAARTPATRHRRWSTRRPRSTVAEPVVRRPPSEPSAEWRSVSSWVPCSGSRRAGRLPWEGADDWAQDWSGQVEVASDGSVAGRCWPTPSRGGAVAAATRTWTAP